MVIDTGAAVSIISQQEYRRSFAHLPLEGARVKLKTYTGECIPVLGQFTATVQYEDQVNELPLIVVKGNGPNLCGRNWLQKVKLNWKIIRHVSKQPGFIQEVLDKYSEVFKDELGTLKDIKATISVKPDVPPKFFKSRPLPFAMKERVENLMKDLKVIVYLDDLLITGKDEQEHLTNICKVLQRLQESGLRVKKCKCEWGQTRIEYLGHVIDEKGVYPTKDKVKAIQDAPAPSNVKELRAFLGLVNYYGRFVPQQSTVLAPLYRVFKKTNCLVLGEKGTRCF